MQIFALQVRQVLEKSIMKPAEYIKIFDKYSSIITREVRSCFLIQECKSLDN